MSCQRKHGSAWVGLRYNDLLFNCEWKINKTCYLWEGITVDIEGASALVDFEVIEIVYNSNPYPTLLGIDWANNMNGVINLKKHKTTFKKNSLRVVVPLDPVEGSHYIEPVCNYDNDDDVDCIYKITMWE